MFRLHPAGQKLVLSRYQIGDVKRMVQDAIADSNNGHNVYIEGRTVRRDLGANERGKIEDTVRCFALVIDADADTSKTWTPPPDVQASLEIESSAGTGNRQYWFFLEQAVSPDDAKKLGARMRASSGGDSKSGDPVQPWRVAGTINYPGAAKQRRGRVVTPTRLVNHTGKRWTVAELEAAFPAPQKRPASEAVGNADDESAVDPELMKLIEEGAPEGDRSEVFYRVVATLKQRHGFSVDGIVTLLEKYPNGIAAKYAGRVVGEVRRVYEKIKHDSADETPRDANPIKLVPGRLHRIVREIAEAVLADEENTTLFQRGAMLCRLNRHTNGSNSNPTIRRAPGALTIVPVDKYWLRRRAMEASAFVRYDVRAKGRVPTDLPLDYAATLQSSPDIWPFPELRGTIEAPTLRPDGSVLDRPGYDHATGLFYDPGDVTFPPVLAEPTKEDAERGLAQLEDVIREFPFVDEASRSGMLAEMLTAVVRRTLPTAPMFFHDAPEKASGKTLLAKIVALLMSARDGAVMTYTGDEAEDRKRMTASLLAGDPVVVFDNVDRVMRSGSLCAILTSPNWRDRILGVSQNAEVPTNVTWIATGNNLRVAGDLAARGLRIRIDAKVEKPEEREFECSDLRGFILANRPQLVNAALTTMRAHIVAGRPKQLITPCRFYEWSDRVRSALVWLGRADPWESQRALADSEPDHEAHATLLRAWWNCFGSKPVRAHEVISRVSKADSPGRALLEALELALYDSRLGAKTLGYWLRSHIDRFADGLVLRQVRSDPSHGSLWTIEGLDGRGKAQQLAIDLTGPKRVLQDPPPAERGDPGPTGWENYGEVI